MKLWKSTITYKVTVVIASEEEPIHEDIEIAAEEEGTDCGYSYQAAGPTRLVSCLADVPLEWKNALPRRGYDDKTCAEILAENSIKE